MSQHDVFRPLGRQLPAQLVGGIGAERDVNGSFPQTGVDQLCGESQREPVLLLARREIAGAKGSNDAG